MSLHAISVFDKVLKWSPEKNCTSNMSKAPLSASKEQIYASDQKYPTHFSP